MLNYVCAESRHIIVGPCKDILVFFQKVNQACSFFESQSGSYPNPKRLGLGCSSLRNTFFLNETYLMPSIPFGQERTILGKYIHEGATITIIKT